LNSVSVYVHMGLTNPAPGVVDFNGFRALQPLYDAAREAGVWVVLRPGKCLAHSPPSFDSQNIVGPVSFSYPVPCSRTDVMVSSTSMLKPRLEELLIGQPRKLPAPSAQAQQIGRLHGKTMSRVLSMLQPRIRYQMVVQLLVRPAY